METRTELTCKTYIEQRESKKTQKPYYVLVSDFGAYQVQNFLNQEQVFILNNLSSFSEKNNKCLNIVIKKRTKGGS